MTWPTSTLSDEKHFIWLSGLWKGKTPPFRKALVVRNTNFLNDGRLDLRDVAVLDVDSDQLASRTLQAGDIIVERSGGGPKQPVGRVAYFEHGGSLPYSFSNFTSVLRVRSDSGLLPRFVHYYLLHLYRSGFTVGLQRATTGLRNLDFAAYKEASIPVPPAGEQEAIVRVLDRAQEGVSIEERLLAATRDLKQATMQELFTCGLRREEQKETEVGRIPGSWRVTTLGEVAELERGRFTHRPRNEPRFYGGRTPFVQTGDVVQAGGRIRRFSQTLNEAGVAISRVFPEGTLLITIAANIGFTGILTFPSACPDSLIGITPKQGVDAEYLNYYLQSQ